MYKLKGTPDLAPIVVYVMLRPMTLNIRRTLLNVLFFLAFLAFTGAVITWIAWFQGWYPGSYNYPSQTVIWWDIMRPGYVTDLLGALGGLSFLILLPFIWEPILRRRFGTSPSPEMFFLRLFLLTLPFQAVRFAVPPALNGTLDILWADSVTRVAWAARLIGILSLMNIGLYSGEIPFRRSGAILGVGALAVIAVAVTIPLDSTQPLGNLLLRPGSLSTLALVCLVMELLALLTVLGNAFTTEKNRYFLLALFLLLIISGMELTFFVSTPLIIPGAILMNAGLVGFASEIRKIYLWI